MGRCLLKHGIPAVLYERMPSPSRHSYGITLHASSYRPLLKVLNIDESTFRRRVSVDGAIGGRGEISPKSLVHPADIDSASFRAHREKLESLLREGLDIKWNHTIGMVEEGTSGMALSIGEQKINSSCTIGVDGPHSTTRKSLSPNTPLKVLPFVAFNGKRHIERTLFDSAYAPSMRSSNIIQLKRDDVLMQVHVNEQQADTVTVSWIYSRPARGSSDPLHKPNRSVSEATEIPDEFFEEIEAIQGLEEPFKDVFNVEKLRKERVLHWLMRTVLVSLQELQALGRRGVFLMGDAVRADPILGGEGANVAITDGLELADCIARKGPEGIAVWYDAKYPSWEAGIRSSEKAVFEMHAKDKAAL